MHYQREKSRKKISSPQETLGRTKSPSITQDPKPNHAIIKHIDKFEYEDVEVTSPDSIILLQATHTILKQQFTLKKIIIADNQNISKYNQLINQITIFKEFTASQAFLKCHKIIKTVNNLYIVFDHIELSNILNTFIPKNKHKLSEYFKTLLLENIILSIIEIKAKNIQFDLSLNSVEIFLEEEEINSSEHQTIKLKMIKMIAMENAEKIVPESNRKLNINRYVEGLLKVIEFIGLAQNFDEQSLIIKKHKNKIATLIEIHLLNPTSESEKYDKLLSYFMSKKGEEKAVQKKQLRVSVDLNLSRSKSSTSRMGRKQKMERQNGEVGNMNLNETMNRSTVHGMEYKYKKYTKRIIKTRNFSILLMSFAKVCLYEILYPNHDTVMMMAFLLFKKSTIKITELAKTLSTGYINQYIQNNEKQFTYFTKTSDFTKLNLLINEEMNLSKTWLGSLSESIVKNYDELLKNKIFEKQLNTAKLDISFFKEILKKYLKEVCSKTNMHKLAKVSQETLVYLTLMSYIFDFQSFQKMYHQFFDESIYNLEDQPLFRQISKMESSKIIEKYVESIQKIK